MNDISKRTKHLGVKVSDAKYKEIVSFADEKGISISALLVLAVSEYIKANTTNNVYIDSSNLKSRRKYAYESKNCNLILQGK